MSTNSAADNAPLRAALPLVVVLTLVWGTNWPLFPLAMREVSVWTFRAISVTTAGLALLLMARLLGQSLWVPPAHRRTLVLAALLYLVVWNVASAYAAVLIPSGQAAILGFTMPLWAALAAWALLGQKLERRALLAVALSGLGVVLLIARGAQTYANAPLGFALGLLAGVAWAAGTLVLKQRPVPVPALVLSGWQMLVAAVPIVAMALWLGQGPWFMPSWTTVALITYISLVPMAIGNAAWFTIASRLPGNVAGLSSVMVPVVAMISGAIVHGEPLGLTQWLAMLCCASGLGLMVYKPASHSVAKA